MRPDFVLETDASNLGWGAACMNQETGGVWNSKEKKEHINYLEMRAGQFALQSFRSMFLRNSVLLKMDNITAVTYINKLGGSRSRRLTDCSGNLGILSGAQDISSGSISSRSRQFSGGLVYEEFDRLQRLDVGQGTFSGDTISFWPSGDRSVCLQTNLSVGGVLQLETGSGGISCGCIQTVLEREKGLCFSSLFDDSEGVVGGKETGCSDSIGDSFLDNSGLVSFNSGVGCGGTIFDSSLQWNVNRSRGRRTSFGSRGFAQPSSLEDIRGSGGFADLLGSASDLLRESWAPGTRKSYKGAWSVWSRWCLERDLDPLEADERKVSNFLANLFEKGLSYRTINC